MFVQKQLMLDKFEIKSLVFTLGCILQIDIWMYKSFSNAWCCISARRSFAADCSTSIICKRLLDYVQHLMWCLGKFIHQRWCLDFINDISFVWKLCNYTWVMRTNVLNLLMKDINILAGIQEKQTTYIIFRYFFYSLNHHHIDTTDI